MPKGTQFVVDLGGGQLAVATVTRSNGDVQGLEFEHSLIEDGSGGLCTRIRVSPYALAAAGTPLAALAPGRFLGMDQGVSAAPSHLRNSRVMSHIALSRGQDGTTIVALEDSANPFISFIEELGRCYSEAE